MRVAQLHRPLVVVAALMAALAVLAAAGITVDDRMLVGVPIWLKPLKFAVSIAVYAVTIAWMVSLLDRHRRFGWWLGTVIAATMLIEMVVMVGQAARGHQSHFNNQTPLDATLFSIMGATIAIAWLATLGLGILLLIQRLPDRADTLAVRFGLLAGLGGMAIGALMTMPTKAQLAEDSPGIVGAHSVGVADGGPGLPLVNWSTTGGDLRAGHFIGMHALQALPLIAFGLTLLSRRLPRLRAAGVRTRLVAVAGLAYAGLTVLVTWQALRGQPLIHPDALTLAVAGGLLLTTAGGVVWAVARTGDTGDTAAPAPAPVPAEVA
ncbi:hypothetical protein Drose_29735 [Dactylosporangium roseum]|uniref:Uncharacterized protein n=1 Tax=Dactylosporangium roseum TaxID=47989 RepID=A0ABY5Z2L0_9ACTN|nr:hypothetical protein [Dactylosporangium roseum]UWZ35295.1 hypothetical protein Drose_29735 [Dactylosporangium roseum]